MAVLVCIGAFGKLVVLGIIGWLSKLAILAMSWLLKRLMKLGGKGWTLNIGFAELVFALLSFRVSLRSLRSRTFKVSL